MFNRVQNAVWVLAALVVLAVPAAAQVTVGDNTKLSAGGDLSFGYSGTTGNLSGSSHALDMGGHGWMRGYYYKPQFLSFDIQPYYRRSQSDSIFQTITNGSGFTANASLFSGTHFPGYISFGKTYDGTGQFGIPGITGITSHGNGQNFAIGWSAVLPRFPTLTATYSTTAGTSSIFGANAENNSRSRNFTLQSTYRVAGFQLLGQYLHLSSNSTFPAFFSDVGTQESNNGSHSFMVNAGHSLPLAGHWNLVWNRSNYTGEYRSGTMTGSNNGVVNDLNTLVSFNPMPKLGLYFGANYNDNAFGALQQRILESGGLPLPILSSSLRTFSVNGQVGYTLFSHLGLYARTSHYEQWLPGERRGMTQFSGNAAFNFSKSYLGSLNFSVGVIDTATQEGNSGASLVGNVNYLRRVQGWELGADFSYLQQVQTLFAIYTTSTYRYGGQVRRRFRDFRWLGSFNGSHSGLTQFDGFGSRSESFSTSIQYRRVGLNGQYSQSAGRSILTSAGLIEVPVGVPPPLLQLPVLYNARSFGGGASLVPFRRCTVSVNYNQAKSATGGYAIPTGFQSTILNSRLQYRLRKLDLDANFTRFRQSINTGTLPAVINTYYIRVSRWFNLF